MAAEPDGYDEKAEVKEVTDDRVKGLLGNRLVEGEKKPAEDGHAKSPSCLVSFRAGENLDSEEDKPGSHTGKKQQENDPE
jgi:hypothetical protein